MSKPSVNQLYISASIVRASSRRPCVASSRARLVVARNSHDLALLLARNLNRPLKAALRFRSVGIVLPSAAARL